MPDLIALHDEARRLVAHHRWEEAALAFARLAALCDRQGHHKGARGAWEAAGETWRRADHPVAAARALRMAIALDPEAWLVRVKLAGVLADVGELSRAEATCRRVIAGAERLAIRAMAIDTAVGILEARGLKEEARDLVAQLPSGEEPRHAAARWFREGQLHRMDGHLADAAHAMGQVIAALEDVPEAGAGLAAARSELAEVALLRGDHREAIAFYTTAVGEQRASGRRSLALRADAGRVRAMVEAGVQPLGHDLDDGVPWAQERALVVLVTDLRIARGMYRAGRDPARAAADLDEAARVADEHEMPLRAGRARLERATRVPASPGLRRALLDRALRDLGASAVMAARAALALAEAWRETDPSRACRYAVQASARFSAMGLEASARAARDLLHELA